MYKIFISITTVILLLISVNAWAFDDPAIPWHEMESDHFIIHYPANRYLFAQRSLSIAEEAHRKLSPLLRWEPREKTNITVIDSLDEANGITSVTPENKITLYTYPPEVSSELGDYDDWMRQLIYHEYTHVLHIDRSSIVYDVIAAIFGKVFRTNVTAPKWYKEGLAVFYESFMSDSGRLRNVIYRVIIRNAALDGVLPNLHRMSAGLILWPATGGYYIYGSSIIKYVANRFGLETLTDWNETYVKHVIPCLSNWAAKTVWGMKWNKIIDDWKEMSIENAHQEMEAAKALGRLTPHQKIVEPHRHGHVQLRPHHHSITYVRNDGFRIKAIVERDLETGEEKKVVDCWGSCKHRWTTDGSRMIFMHMTEEDGYLQTYRLYEYDSRKKFRNVSKLELPDRVRSFDIDGEYIYFVTQDFENTSIYRQHYEGDGEYEHLYRSKPFEQIEDLSVRNGRMVAAIFDVDKFQFDIETIDLHDNDRRIVRKKITDDKAPDMSPFYCDEHHICYVSTRSGELNLWEYDLRSETSTRKTHLMDGMLDPVLDENGDIYYTQYTSMGTTISWIKSWDIEDHGESKDQRKRTIEYEPLENVALSAPKKDLAWEWMFPKMWIPSFGFDDDVGGYLGIFVSGKDEKGHHSYSLGFDYLLKKNNINFDLNYEWTGGLWNLGAGIGIKQGVTGYYDNNKYKSIDYQALTGNIYAQKVFNQRMSLHRLKLLYRFQFTEANDPVSWEHKDPTGYPVELPSLGWQNALVVNWEWSNMQMTERFMYSNDGYSTKVGMSCEAPWLGADYYTLYWYVLLNGAWTMPYLRSHSISARWDMGASWSQNKNRMPFSVSSSRGFTFNTSGEDSYLHGYPSGSIYGKFYYYGNFSYSAVIWEPELSYSTLPVGIDRFGLTGFFDWGDAWSDNLNLKKSKFDIGLKLHVDLILAYTWLFRVTIGYAWGGTKHGGHEVFLYFFLI